MERLVAVGLWYRDPVLHSLWVRNVHVGHYRVDLPAQRFLFLQRSIDDDADGKDVIDLVESGVVSVELVQD